MTAKEFQSQGFDCAHPDALSAIEGQALAEMALPFAPKLHRTIKTGRFLGALLIISTPQALAASGRTTKNPLDHLTLIQQIGLWASVFSLTAALYWTDALWKRHIFPTVKWLGKAIHFVSRPIRRLVMQPAVLRDTMRYAISIAMGLAAYQMTGSTFALAWPFTIDLLAFGSMRFFSKPNQHLADPILQRRVGLTASLVPIILGGSLAFHHASLLLINLAAAANGILMGWASHLREPPSSEALAPKGADEHFPERSSGARLFGPVLAFSGVLIGQGVQGLSAPVVWTGILLLVGGIIHGAASLWITGPAAASVNEPIEMTESPAALLERDKELQYPFFLQVVLSSLNAVPWVLPSLVAWISPWSTVQRTWAQVLLSLAIYLGSRFNIRIQEHWRLTDKPILSWWFAFFPTGGLLIAAAMLPSLWCWLPMFFVIGTSMKMGAVVSKKVAESYPPAYLRNSRALYSTAVHLGIAISPLLFAWLAAANAPQAALIICGRALIFFQLAIAGPRALRKFILDKPDVSLPLVMAGIAGARTRSLAAAAAWFAYIFTGIGVVNRMAPWIILRIQSEPETENHVFRQPPQGRFARPGHPQSVTPEAWTPGRKVILAVPTDLHIGNPKFNAQSELTLNMLQNAVFEPTLQPDGMAMPAVVLGGDIREYYLKFLKATFAGQVVKVVGRIPEAQKVLVRYLRGLAIRKLRVVLLGGDHDMRFGRRASANPPRPFVIREGPISEGGKTLAEIEVAMESLFTLPDGRRGLAQHGHVDAPLNSDDGFWTRFYLWFENGDTWIKTERAKLGVVSHFYLVPFAKLRLIGPFLRMSLYRRAKIAEGRNIDLLIFGHLHIPGIWWAPLSRLWVFSPWLYETAAKLSTRWIKPQKLIVNAGSATEVDGTVSIAVIAQDGTVELWIWRRVMQTPASAHTGAEELASAS